MSEIKTRIQNLLDENVEGMLKAWNLPGVAVGVIKDGEIIVEKGYGLRNEAENLPMTKNTMLPAGSITKTFTALAAAMLADEGKVDLDTPVIEYVPDLKLYTEELTKNVTLRDLLSHQSGLPGYDVQSVFAALDDRGEMVKTLEYLQPSLDMRTALQYSNQMVMLAGYVVEKVSGQSWEEFVTKRILEPLGMKDTCLTVDEIPQWEDHAAGYVNGGTQNIQMPYLPLKAVAPAGSINSTITDMMKFMAFQLSDGTVDGKQLVSKAMMDEMHKVQVNGSPYFWKLGEIENPSYGLCWFVDQYKGKTMLSHGGNTLGFSALMTLIPDEDLGIILLSNSTSNFMIYPLTYSIIDEVSENRQDWNSTFMAALAPVMEGMAQGPAARAAARIPDTTPTLPLEAYAGTYTNPAFGQIVIESGENGLSGKMNGFDMMISHYNYDEFDTVLLLMGVPMPVTFVIEDGVVTGLKAVAEPNPAIDPFFFAKA